MKIIRNQFGIAKFKVENEEERNIVNSYLKLLETALNDNDGDIDYYMCWDSIQNDIFYHSSSE
jgi:hypothetical protein